MYKNWDCPEALDMDLFGKKLMGVKKGGTDDGDCIGENRSTLSDQDIPLSLQSELCLKLQETLKSLQDKLNQRIQIVLVDGFLLYCDDRIIEALDCCVFLHASFRVLKQRRESRQGYITLEGEFWSLSREKYTVSVCTCMQTGRLLK
jgi:nicotinamide/nicotinate riboside kinase